MLFPGGNYSVDKPLLYYANFKYEVRGYEELKICYGEYNTVHKDTEEWMSEIKKSVLQLIREVDFSEYEDIVFASKSMGTVIAGWLAKELDIKVRHIFLTPIKATLPYINGDNNIVVVSGIEDKYLNSEILREHCKREGVYLKQFEGVGHNLEVYGDMNTNIDILKQVVELY